VLARCRDGDLEFRPWLVMEISICGPETGRYCRCSLLVGGDDFCIVSRTSLDAVDHLPQSAVS
jgi:hypothetical protein